MTTDLQMRTLIVALCLLLTGLTLAMLHWALAHKDLDRIPAYTIGVTVLLGVPIVAMVLTWAAGLHYGHLYWAGLLVANAVAGGAAVWLAYAIDERRPITLDQAKEHRRGPQP